MWYILLVFLFFFFNAQGIKKKWIDFEQKCTIFKCGTNFLVFPIFFFNTQGIKKKQTDFEKKCTIFKCGTFLLVFPLFFFNTLHKFLLLLDFLFIIIYYVFKFLLFCCTLGGTRQNTRHLFRIQMSKKPSCKKHVSTLIGKRCLVFSQNQTRVQQKRRKFKTW